MSLPNTHPKNHTPAIIAACLLLLTALSDSHVVPAIAPQIAQGLNTSKSFIAFTVSAYAVAAATIAITLAKNSSKLVIDRWLLVACGLFMVGNIVTATAPHPAIFFVGRTIGGFAGGLISALTIAGIANAADYAKRGRQMSGVAVCYFLAPVLGVPIGTFLTASFGWRAFFSITLTLALIATAFIYFYPLPNTPTNKEVEESINIPKTGSSWKYLWQLAMRSPATKRGILGAFFVSGGLVGFVTYLGIWLSDAFFLTTKQIGLSYALAGVTAVVGGALGGIFADRVGKQKMVVLSSKAMALMLLILPTLNWSISLFVLIGIVSTLAALRVAPLQALVTELVNSVERPSYIALRNTGSQIGIALAVALSGQVYKVLGIFGVCLVCSILTIGAWLSIQGIVDPGAKTTYIKKVTWKTRIVEIVVTLVLLVTIILPWTVSFLITKANTRPDERFRTETPAQYGAEYKDIEFKSSDGNKLLGWYLPSRTQKITFVMTHGMFRSRYEMLDRSIDLWKEGYGVLLYDLRHHRQSSGEYSSLGFYEKNDVIAATKFANEQAPDNKIVLMGVSMGAAATLLASTELAQSPLSKQIIAIVAESSFLSFRDVVYHHCELAHFPTFPFGFLITNITAFRMNFKVDDFDLLAAVKKIPYPILFIGSSADKRMPIETVLEPLYGAASNPNKAKYIVNGATHGKAYELAQKDYIKTVIDFISTGKN